MNPLDSPDGRLFVLCVSDFTSSTTLNIEPIGLSIPTNIEYDHESSDVLALADEDTSFRVPTETHLVHSHHNLEATFENDRFYCPHCNVKYTKLKYLKTHMKNCGQTFNCKFCERDYKQKRTWMLHMRTKHLEEWDRRRKPLVENAFAETTVEQLEEYDDYLKEEHLL